MDKKQMKVHSGRTENSRNCKVRMKDYDVKCMYEKKKNEKWKIRLVMQ